MKQLLVAFLGICVSWVSAQSLTDNFSDGNFNANPSWAGDVADFTVNGSQELQLNATPATATKSLYVNAATSTSAATTWECYARLNFAPSANNNARIYLASSGTDFTNTNGYYILIGENGTTDALKLYRQNGATSTLLTAGTAGAVATNPTVSIRVTRSTAGDWQIYADYTGGTNFVADGASVSDVTFTSGNYFGVFCKYTTTNSANFNFDNVSVSPLFVDVVPPSLVSATAISATQVDVLFNEPMGTASVNTPASFTINNGISVSAAARDASNFSLVHLTVSSLTNLSSYTLTAQNTADIAGNSLTTANTNFTYAVSSPANPGDLIFTEIMADPSPVIGSLPDGEWVEIYNTSNHPIDLGGLQLVENGATADILPSYQILPNSYVVICDDAFAGDFLIAGIVNVVTLSTFPSLTNAGEAIRLKDAAGVILDSVFYSSDWYQDAVKEDGGWSLELVNPNLTCRGGENWKASNNPNGASAGAQNSTWQTTLDNTAPTLSATGQLSNNTIRLTFSEPMSDVMLAISQYQLSPNIAISSAAFDATSNRRIIVLTLASNLVTQTNYTVTCATATDCSGNTGATSGQFVFYETQSAVRYDVIINEIFADPSPQIGLKDKDFVELYNRSNKVINLAGFIVTDGTSNRAELPLFLLQPNAYVLVYSNNDTISYEEYGDVLAVDLFPTLNVGADNIVLYNPTNEVIDAVPYTLDWYQDNGKADGGWTLERINPNLPCEGANNWSASNNLRGGTPDEANSILDLNTTSSALDILRVYPFANDSLRLYFNKALDESSALDLANYVVDNGINVTSARLEPPLYSSLVLGFNQPLTTGVVYNITLQSGFTDCIGNSISSNNTARFALPESIAPNDIVLNEILFNPVPYGSDFVELYNRSNKVLNVGDLIFANANATGQVSVAENVLTDYLLFPGEYVAVTDNPTQVKTQYYTPSPKHFIQNDLPTYDDSESTVFIFTGVGGLGGTIIDQVTYSNKWHTPLLDDEEGVSLERLSVELPTNDANNWHSAATAVGYATPAYENSNAVQNLQTEGTDIFFFSNDEYTLSPDGDGFQDYLLLSYHTDAPGYIANINIYDAQGRLVKTFKRSELLGTDGVLQWDGTQDDETKARLGIYLIRAEVFNAAGTVKVQKLNCVVAGRL